MPSLRHEWLFRFIQRRKPLSNIGENRLQKHALGNTTDTHSVSLKTKLSRQPYSLAASILE